MLFLVYIVSFLFLPERPHPECPHIYQVDTHKKVYTQPTAWPRYPGGHDGLFRDFHQHFNYPSKQTCYPQRMVLRYTVEANGQATDWEVFYGIEGNTKQLDSAVLEAVQHLKPFFPGTCYGTPVTVQRYLPIRVHYP